MTSKKNASTKRATLPRVSDYAKSFVKDWERLSRSGKFDMRRLKEVMLRLIANDGPLGPEWKDHALTGPWSGHRECHIGGDFLLIYWLDNRGTDEVIGFVRTGTLMRSYSARSEDVCNGVTP